MAVMSARNIRKAAKVAEIQANIASLEDQLAYASDYGDTVWVDELRLCLANAREELAGWTS